MQTAAVANERPAVTIQTDDFSTPPATARVLSAAPASPNEEAVERALIIFALDAMGGNRTRAARLLRLTRSALLYRLQKYGLTEKQGLS